MGARIPLYCDQRSGCYKLFQQQVQSQVLCIDHVPAAFAEAKQTLRYTFEKLKVFERKIKIS